MKKKKSIKKSVPVAKKSVSAKKPAIAAPKPTVIPAPAKPATPVPSVKPAVSATPAKPAALVVAPVIKKRTLYVEVTPDKYFVLCDGRKVKSGKELADILQSINDDMFKYHVTDTKNDFANWINDVFGESDLAKKMKTIKNRLDTSIELYRAMFDRLDKISKK